MHACEMTLTYLRVGLLTYFVVSVEFEYFSLKFIKIFDATVQKFPIKLEKTPAHTFFYKSRLRLRNPFLGVRFLCACLRL